MRDFSLTVGDQQFSGTTASAEQQFEALHICGRTGVVGLIKDDVNPSTIVIMLLQAPLEEVRKLEKLLVSGKVTRAEDSVPVASNLFVDSIHRYYLLIAMVILENLQGFSELRSQTDASKGAAEQS